MKKVLFFIICISFLPAFLLKEDPYKKTLQIAYGMSIRQGRKPYMYDSFIIAKVPVEHHLDYFFGLFDGYGGLNVSRYAADRIHNLFAQYSGSIEKNLTKAFLQTDNELLDRSILHNRVQTKWAQQGTMAITALFEGTDLYIASTGNSRAILLRGGTILSLTEDHTPALESERERIERQKGKIVEGVLPKVRGELVSRTIGYYQKKINPKTNKIDNVIIATPDITKVKLQLSDRLLILAPKSVWNVMTDKEVVAVVKKALENKQFSLPYRKEQIKDEYTYEKHNDVHLQYAARALCDAAYENGGLDNISVIIIKLLWEVSGVEQDGKKLLLRRLKQLKLFFDRSEIPMYAQELDPIITRLEEFYNKNLLLVIERKIDQITRAILKDYETAFLSSPSSFAPIVQSIYDIIKSERRKHNW